MILGVSVYGSVFALVDNVCIYLQVSSSHYKKDIFCLCEHSHKFIGYGWETVSSNRQNEHSQMSFKAYKKKSLGKMVIPKSNG